MKNDDHSEVVVEATVDSFLDLTTPSNVSLSSVDEYLSTYQRKIKIEEAVFMKSISEKFEVVQSHYLSDDFGGESGYVQCNGEDCNSCKANRRVVSLVIYPFYNIESGRPEYLTFTKSNKRSSLCFQLMSNLQNNKDSCLEIGRPDTYSYSVSPIEISESKISPSNLEMAIKFVESDSFHLSSLITKKSNEDICWSYPAIRKRLELKGLI